MRTPPTAGIGRTAFWGATTTAALAPACRSIRCFLGLLVFCAIHAAAAAVPSEEQPAGLSSSSLFFGQRVDLPKDAVTTTTSRTRMGNNNLRSVTGGNLPAWNLQWFQEHNEPQQPQQQSRWTSSGSDTRRTVRSRVSNDVSDQHPRYVSNLDSVLSDDDRVEPTDTAVEKEAVASATVSDLWLSTFSFLWGPTRTTSTTTRPSRSSRRRMVSYGYNDTDDSTGSIANYLNLTGGDSDDSTSNDDDDGGSAAKGDDWLDDRLTDDTTPKDGDLSAVSTTASTEASSWTEPSGTEEPVKSVDASSTYTGDTSPDSTYTGTEQVETTPTVGEESEGYSTEPIHDQQPWNTEESSPPDQTTPTSDTSQGSNTEPSNTQPLYTESQPTSDSEFSGETTVEPWNGEQSSSSSTKPSESVGANDENSYTNTSSSEKEPGDTDSSYPNDQSSLTEPQNPYNIYTESVNTEPTDVQGSDNPYNEPVQTEPSKPEGSDNSYTGPTESTNVEESYGPGNGVDSSQEGDSSNPYKESGATGSTGDGELTPTDAIDALTEPTQLNNYVDPTATGSSVPNPAPTNYGGPPVANGLVSGSTPAPFASHSTVLPVNNGTPPPSVSPDGGSDTDNNTKPTDTKEASSLEDLLSQETPVPTPAPTSSSPNGFNYAAGTTAPTTQQVESNTLSDLLSPDTAPVSLPPTAPPTPSPTVAAEVTTPEPSSPPIPVETKAPSSSPVINLPVAPAPTVSPSTKKEEPTAVSANENHLINDEDPHSNQKLMKEERKIIFFSTSGAVFALMAMIFTAYQMSENPDGIYAATCRLCITVLGLCCRILLSPCKNFFGYSNRHNYYGHVPVSSMDYGYRDPSLELTS